MDQIKIGRFIAERRKKASLTQLQLAERLNITDRAVSKWETGRAMPDSSIMLELCDVLDISVNDLLCGEVVTMDNYNKEMENNLMEMVKEKEKADKHLLSLEIVIGIILMAVMLTLIFVASYAPLDEWVRILLIMIGFVPFLVATPFLIRIEQTAGYYECAECSHRYVPSFNSVLWAAHYGRTRRMKCPRCGRRSWQKKVLSREKE